MPGKAIILLESFRPRYDHVYYRRWDNYPKIRKLMKTLKGKSFLVRERYLNPAEKEKIGKDANKEELAWVVYWR